MALDSLKETLKESLGSINDKLKESLSFLGEIKDAGSEKVNTFVTDILNLAPLIQETGFNMMDVNVDLTIPPSISLNFIKEKEIAPDVIDKLLQENEDKQFFKLIVNAIQKADAFQKGINLTSYSFKGVNIKLGLPPDISMKFEKNNS